MMRREAACRHVPYGAHMNKEVPTEQRPAWVTFNRYTQCATITLLRKIAVLFIQDQ